MIGICATQHRLILSNAPFGVRRLDNSIAKERTAMDKGLIAAASQVSKRKRRIAARTGTPTVMTPDQLARLPVHPGDRGDADLAKNR